MLTLDVKSVKVSSVGNDLENLSWSTVEQIFKENFANSGLLLSLKETEEQIFMICPCSESFFRDHPL